MKVLALPLLGAGVIAALTACDDGKPVGNDTSDTSDTNTSAVTIDFNWDNDGYNMSVANMPGSGYDLGLAETGSPNGWYGEDCYNGTAGYNLCHGFNGASASLTALGDGAAPGDPDDVVAGSTTLLNKDLAYNGDGSDRITYMITFDAGSDPGCIVWGEDAGYYSAFGCTVY